MPELNWVGKDKVITHHLDVPYRVLDRQYSFDKDGQHEADNGSENMIIHGDNLEALKALLPRYEGKVDCIYIDPPYNTGNEGWVYNDAVNDPRIKKWIGEVVGKEGDDLSRHDKWLCMMYPRLRLLQRLLAPTGTIFISIDDHEQASLKLICDEIFGTRNHLVTFVWESSGNTDNQGDIIGTHEYILTYSRNRSLSAINAVVDPNIPADSKIRRNFVENSAIKNGFKNPPSIVELPKGFPCIEATLDLPRHEFAEEFMEKSREFGYIPRSLGKEYAANYPLRLDDIRVRAGKLVSPCRVFTGWMNAKKLRAFINNSCNPVPEGASHFHFYLTKTGAVYYRKEGRQSHYVQSVLRNMGTTETNKYALEAMELTFDYPKPVELLEYLISLYVPHEGVVLDSFAGSGTTGHAVLNLNRRDKGKRHFILVELGDYAKNLTAARVEGAIRSDHELPGGERESFTYYELGAPLLVDGELNPDVPVERVREYVWFTETQQPFVEPEVEGHPYFLGTANRAAYHFIFEPDQVTTLEHEFVAGLTPEVVSDSLVVYADVCALSEAELARWSITFKKIPRDITRL